MKCWDPGDRLKLILFLIVCTLYLGGETSFRIYLIVGCCSRAECPDEGSRRRREKNWSFQKTMWRTTCSRCIRQYTPGSPQNSSRFREPSMSAQESSESHPLEPSVSIQTSCFSSAISPSRSFTGLTRLVTENRHGTRALHRQVMTWTVGGITIRNRARKRAKKPEKRTCYHSHIPVSEKDEQHDMKREKSMFCANPARRHTSINYCETYISRYTTVSDLRKLAELKC